MEFFRQEYWSKLLFPTPGYLPDPETEPASLASPALADGFFNPVPLNTMYYILKWIKNLRIKLKTKKFLEKNRTKESQYWIW